MARLPYDPFPSVEPRSIPNSYMNIDPSGQRAVAQLGQTVVQAGKEGMAAAMDIAGFHARVAAEDAYNQFQSELLDATYGTPDMPGFYTLRGQNALNAYPALRESLTQSRERIAAGLPNAATKLDFDTNSRRLLAITLEQAGNHYNSELATFGVATEAAGVANAARSAGVNWNDDGAFNQAITDAVAATTRSGQIQGWDNNILDQKLNEARTKVVTARVEGMLTRDPGGAYAFLMRHADVVDPQTLDTLVARLRPLVVDDALVQRYSIGNAAQPQPAPAGPPPPVTDKNRPALTLPDGKILPTEPPGRQTVPPRQPTASTIALPTDQPTRTVNAQGFGDRITGKITVNGHTYTWFSGGGGRGSLPFGTYNITGFMSGAERKAGGFSFTDDAFSLSDAKDTTPGTASNPTRTGLLIHAARYGSAGCIGVEGDFAAFSADLKAEAEKRGGLSGISIQVGPTGVGGATSAAAPKSGPIAAGDATTTAFLVSRLQPGTPASNINNMKPELQARLAKLFQNAPASIRDGLEIVSGARTDPEQVSLWNAAVKKYGSEAAASAWVAKPESLGGGGSNHTHGTAADIGYKGAGLGKAPPEVVSWLHDNASTYGLKFPLDNENWHIELAETRGGATAVAHDGSGAGPTHLPGTPPIAVASPELAGLKPTNGGGPVGIPSKAELLGDAARLFPNDTEMQRLYISRGSAMINEITAVNAVSRAELMRTLPDVIAAAEAGVPNIAFPETSVATLMNATEAQHWRDEYAVAVHIGDVMRSVEFAAPADIAAMQADLASGQGVLSDALHLHARQATTGPGVSAADQEADTASFFRLRAGAETKLQSLLDRRQAALTGPTADPAAYAATNPKVKAAAAAIDPKTPSTFDQYAAAQLGLQDYLGVPASGQHVLTRGQAIDMSGKVMASPDAQKALASLEAQFGSSWQHVFHDLVTLGRLPASYQSVASIEDPRDAALLARALEEVKPKADGTPGRTWDDILGDAGGRSVASTIRQSIRVDPTVMQFEHSLSASGASAEQVDSIVSSIETLAFAKQFYDGDPSAAQHAIQSFTKAYTFVSTGVGMTARVPTKYYDATRAAAQTAVAGITADSIAVPPLFGQQGLPSRQEYVDLLKANPGWITSPKEDALWLMDSQGRVVRDLHGDPFAVPFVKTPLREAAPFSLQWWSQVARTAGIPGIPEPRPDAPAPPAGEGAAERVLPPIPAGLPQTVPRGVLQGILVPALQEMQDSGNDIGKATRALEDAIAKSNITPAEADQIRTYWRKSFEPGQEPSTGNRPQGALEQPRGAVQLAQATVDPSTLPGSFPPNQTPAWAKDAKPMQPFTGPDGYTWIKDHEGNVYRTRQPLPSDQTAGRGRGLFAPDGTPIQRAGLDWNSPQLHNLNDAPDKQKVINQLSAEVRGNGTPQNREGVEAKSNTLWPNAGGPNGPDANATAADIIKRLETDPRPLDLDPTSKAAQDFLQNLPDDVDVYFWTDYSGTQLIVKKRPAKQPLVA